MRVIIEESAIADIDGLAAWVGNSAQGARSVVEKILKTIERLKLFPEMGHEGSDDGKGVDPRRADSGLGGRLVEGFTQQLGGQVERESGSQGTTVRVILPSPEGS